MVSGALGESGVCVGHGILGWVGVRTSVILFYGTIDFVEQNEFFCRSDNRVWASCGSGFGVFEVGV